MPIIDGEQTAAKLGATLVFVWANIFLLHSSECLFSYGFSLPNKRSIKENIQKLATKIGHFPSSCIIELLTMSKHYQRLSICRLQTNNTLAELASISEDLCKKIQNSGTVFGYFCSVQCLKE